MKPILLSAAGRELHQFGGDDAWRVYESGDYIVSIEMVEDEPGCAIWPARGDGGVYAVCLSAFPYFMNADGRPTPQAWEMVYRGLERMGREITRADLVRVMGMVIDAFTWVARMPPRPKARPEPIYEATAMVNGSRFHERAV